MGTHKFGGKTVLHVWLFGGLVLQISHYGACFSVTTDFFILFVMMYSMFVLIIGYETSVLRWLVTLSLLDVHPCPYIHNLMPV